MRAIIPVLLALAAGGAQAQGLPGGASSLNEVHGNWTIACVTPEGTARCTLSQVQIDSGSQQRVLAIELAAAEGGAAARGTLVLPFGLALDDGVTLAVDEGAALPLRFSTCLPAGCLVPLDFDGDAVARMQTGAALKVTAAASDSGKEVSFAVSLSGFAAALARAAELTAP